jgi:DNA/RNA-binding domain of Phe-tRNA-synthetase-like protein
MKYAIEIDPAVLSKFPSYTALIVTAENVSNGPSNELSLSLLRQAEEQQRKAFAGSSLSAHPHIAVWREAFKTFGSKPSKYLCSAEALLERTLKGNEIPGINQLTDIYNALSVRYVIPIGGEDCDHVTSNVRLSFATGQETFDTVKDGEPVLVNPDVGEAIWADSSGVTCRRWNWRQCKRTVLSHTTRNAYFLIDRLAPFPLDELTALGTELIGILQNQSPGCKTNMFLVRLPDDCPDGEKQIAELVRSR